MICLSFSQIFHILAKQDIRSIAFSLVFLSISPQEHRGEVDRKFPVSGKRKLTAHGRSNPSSWSPEVLFTALSHSAEIKKTPPGLSCYWISWLVRQKGRETDVPINTMVRCKIEFFFYKGKTEFFNVYPQIWTGWCLMSLSLVGYILDHEMVLLLSG